MSGIDRSEFFDLLHALARLEPRPRAAVESAPGSGDSGVDVFRASLRNFADRFFGVRGYHRKPLLGGGFAPAAADEQFVIATVIKGLRHRAPPHKRRG
jgi:hypothetical protein